MNREIKFRGLTLERKKWVYGFALHLKGKDLIVDPYIMESQNISNTYEVIGETISQFTGLKDKHGKEIFEGDVVQTHRFIEVLGHNLGVSEGEEENVCVVKYFENDMEFILYPIKNNVDCGYLKPSMLSDEGVEIIGTVFENPELLEVK